MITLFGSTGYTGVLAARALAEAGLPFRLAGRSADKLAAQSHMLPGKPPFVVADARQPETLAGLFAGGTRVLINCAGPFTDLGEKVLSLAALNGVHYLDVTNELGYCIRARSYHSLAQSNGAAVVPSCGFEVAVADCLVARLAGQFAPGTQFASLDVLYVLRGVSASAGTKQSAVRSLATSWMVYRGGGFRGQVPGGRAKVFNTPSGRVEALAFPSCEAVTVPSYLDVRDITVWMNFASGARIWGPLLVPLGARLSRSILRPLILKLAAGGSPQPGQDEPEGSFEITASLMAGGVERSAGLTGPGPYPLTAKILAYCARQMLAPGYTRAGVLAPSQAFDPEDLLSAVL